MNYLTLSSVLPLTSSQLLPNLVLRKKDGGYGLILTKTNFKASGKVLFEVLLDNTKVGIYDFQTIEDYFILDSDDYLLRNPIEYVQAQIELHKSALEYIPQRW